MATALDQMGLAGSLDRRSCNRWVKTGGDSAMTYDHFFSGALGRLHAERRYRVFADL
jgi:hypothetical protein